MYINIFFLKKENFHLKFKQLVYYMNLNVWDNAQVLQERDLKLNLILGFCKSVLDIIVIII